MKFEREFSLKSYNSFRISVKTRYFVEISTDNDFSELCGSRFLSQNKIFVIGSGSNVLFSDYFDGTVIKINFKDIEIVGDDKDTITIRCGAGCLWDDLVRYCVSHKFYGLENLGMIPGTVGAAPVQNIGAYGVEQRDFFHRLDAVNFETKNKFSFNSKQCKFEYRDSIFKHELKNNVAVSSVEYKLFKEPIFNLGYKDLQEKFSDKDTIDGQSVYDAICEIRRSKLPDPKDIGNAGSFFKNPIIDQNQFDQIKSKFDTPSASMPFFEINDEDETKYKIPAAFLIEACGWKGKRVDKCGVYENHSLILVNYGGAKGSDIIKLAESIESSVFEKFGVKLEREVLVV